MEPSFKDVLLSTNGEKHSEWSGRLAPAGAPAVVVAPFFGASTIPDEHVPLLADQSTEEPQKDVPLEGLGSLGEWRTEALCQWRIALPVSSMKVFENLLILVSIAFVGHIGSRELAGAALASTVANISGPAVLEGLASAMETLCGQAYGAGHVRALGDVLQRAILIMTLLCLPIAGLWFKAEYVLVLCGQDPSVAAAAGSYIRALLPYLFSLAWTLPVAQFLQAQSVVLPLAGASCLTLLLHLPLNYLLIYTCKLGFTGAAWATSISQLLNLALLVAYLQLETTGILQRAWGGWSKKALKDWGTYLKLALPACTMMCLEWWCFGLIVLLAGLLPDPERAVSAMTIGFNVDAVCFTLALGLSTAARGASSLLNGLSHKVQVAVTISAAVGAVVFIVLLVFRHQWPLIFTREQQVVALTAALAPFLVTVELTTALLVTCAGVLRGSGQQLAGSVINLVSFYVIGLPSAAYLAFRAHMGVEGLWWGLLLGLTSQLLVMIPLLATTDWRLQVARAQELLGGYECEEEGGASEDVAPQTYVRLPLDGASTDTV